MIIDRKRKGKPVNISGKRRGKVFKIVSPDLLECKTHEDVMWCIANLQPFRLNPVLNYLFMMRTYIGNEGLAMILEAMELPHEIEKLALHNIEVDERMAESLGRFLKRDRKLCSLGIPNNDLGAKGAKAIGEALKINRTLWDLDVSHNHIGVEGIEALAEGLEENWTLRYLTIYGNTVGGDEAETLAYDITRSRERHRENRRKVIALLLKTHRSSPDPDVGERKPDLDILPMEILHLVIRYIEAPFPIDVHYEKHRSTILSLRGEVISCYVF